MLAVPRKRKEKQGIVVCHDEPLQLMALHGV